MREIINYKHNLVNEFNSWWNSDQTALDFWLDGRLLFMFPLEDFMNELVLRIENQENHRTIAAVAMV